MAANGPAQRCVPLGNLARFHDVLSLIDLNLVPELQETEPDRVNRNPLFLKCHLLGPQLENHAVPRLGLAWSCSVLHALDDMENVLSSSTSADKGPAEMPVTEPCCPTGKHQPYPLKAMTFSS